MHGLRPGHWQAAPKNPKFKLTDFGTRKRAAGRHFPNTSPRVYVRLRPARGEGAWHLHWHAIDQSISRMNFGGIPENSILKVHDRLRIYETASSL